MTPDLVIGDDGEVLGMDDPTNEAAQMRSIIADFADQDEKSIVKFFARLGEGENLTLIPNMPIPNPKEWEGTKSYFVMTPFGFYRLDLNNGSTETREEVIGFITNSADRG